ncbi:hypothetical protein [Thermus filiformis]|uniref:hypothetical protein n=1 Tax=Thermus filiformis TaxID=276 RepID=UPI001269DD28|nr:hypothetical protein [Thermus filiformis]
MPRGEHLRRIPRAERARRLGQTPLSPGEASETLQVRGPEGVVQALKALPPAERGKVAGLGLVARDYWDDPEKMKRELAEIAELLYRLEDLPRPVRWLLARLGVRLPPILEEGA